MYKRQVRKQLVVILDIGLMMVLNGLGQQIILILFRRHLENVTYLIVPLMKVLILLVLVLVHQFILLVMVKLLRLVVVLLVQVVVSLL